jgi:ABC-2 type transport system permease protein
MLQVFRKELNSALNSLIAYLIIGVFLAGIGLLMWVFPETSVLDYGYAEMSTLFDYAPYVFIFLIPAVTMHSFSEEMRAGTLELLLTRPLSNWDIVIGKYLASLLVVIFAVVPTLVYYFTLYYLGSPMGNLDTPGIMGSYVGLLLLAASFTAIGILSSTLSSSQVISFLIAAFVCFILYSGLSSLASIDVWGTYSLFLQQLSLVYHYEALSRGLIDSRNVIYLLSVVATLLFLARFWLSSKRW